MKGSDKTDGGKGLVLSRTKYLPEIIRKLKEWWSANSGSVYGELSCRFIPYATL